MKHHHTYEAGTRKKRPTSWVFFFLPAFGQYCAFSAPPSQLDRPCSPPDVPLTTGSTLRLSPYGQLHYQIWVPDRVGERWVNPLPDEASSEVGTRKKRPASRVFFFLPAFGRCCPSVSAHPANRILCSSNIATVEHFPTKTFSFKHQLIGEAWPACTFSFKHHLTGEAWPACRAIISFHSNTT